MKKYSLEREEELFAEKGLLVDEIRNAYFAGLGNATEAQSKRFKEIVRELDEMYQADNAPDPWDDFC